MVFNLYHRDTPSFMDNSPATLTEFPRGFTLVARVDVPDVGMVFQVTNHIDSDWTDNPEVAIVGSKRLRSTSVGDVITGWTGPTGTRQLRRWSIDGIGLREFKPTRHKPAVTAGRAIGSLRKRFGAETLIAIRDRRRAGELSLRDAVASLVREDRHREQDPHCTCPECIVDHFETSRDVS